MDRYATLPIIRAALGLPPGPNPCSNLTERLLSSTVPSIRISVILEAEMVAYSERTHAIDGEAFRIVVIIYLDIQFECILQNSGGYVVSSNLLGGASDDGLASHSTDP